MTHSINLKNQKFRPNQQFQEFIFIGNTANKSVSDLTEKADLCPDSNFVSQVNLEDYVAIAEIHTNKNISHQLKILNIKPGAIVKLISKTNNGSVVISLGNKLIGMGAEIARQIVTTPVS
ncbi:ferrous iron transport protein A [Waterburya agarophytonicola K14]|uniref:Ferrous iron transport protein A n=1 Tax=Waterburya agarophytonicola KI4 TaxID=2874699 RepID=A0A964BNF8_9CYAN|nr:ferrous iron transport protein A [Waterburya agarophytonicola]MCC0176475.1 ferrous iron transport protein A [Waterburya agarophytonicola KI4]